MEQLWQELEFLKSMNGDKLVSIPTVVSLDGERKVKKPPPPCGLATLALLIVCWASFCIPTDT